MIQTLCFVLFCISISFTTSYDLSHDLPSLARLYPACSFKLSTKSAGTCIFNFQHALNGQNFDPNNRDHCCADWKALACMKNISVAEPECTKNASMISEINKKFREKEETNVNNVCDPYKFNCPSAPKQDLEVKFPYCFAKVKIELERCKPIPADFRFDFLLT